MRKTIAWKMLLRSPLKAILTFLLIMAASFALFSRVTDYAVSMREIRNAESFYYGVAALDNTVPNISLSGQTPELGDYLNIETEERRWPTEQQIEQFSSLPGVTLADTRYVTVGRIKNYRNLVDEESTWAYRGEYAMEAVYQGSKPDPDGTSFINLLFDDVKILASSDDKLDLFDRHPVKVTTINPEKEFTYRKHPCPKELFEKLKKGDRCLVIGIYSDKYEVELSYEGKENFCVINGLDDDYLETEPFAYQKQKIEKINLNRDLYQFVYTSDMRSIPSFNEHNMVVAKGRPLKSGDTDVCVVNDLFLETYHLSIGDKIQAELFDRLSGSDSTSDKKELEIVGSYQFMTDSDMRSNEGEWSYDLNTVFVPESLLSRGLPADYTPDMREFSVLIEDAHDIEAFLQAAEPLVEEIGGVTLRFSDGGWLSVKDSFTAGLRTSLLTAALSLVGSVLALFLAVYLYIGRNKKTYAIMRTLGVTGRLARNMIVFPFALLSLLAMSVGGTAGLLYTSGTADKTLEGMGALKGNVPDTTLPVNVILLCLLFELFFALAATLFFLWRMKKISPLELLQDHTSGRPAKGAADVMEISSDSAGFDISKIPVVSEINRSRSKYRAHYHVFKYILRHMRRGIGKTAVSLVLTAVLTAGVGMFVLARLNYEDAFYKTEVKGRALMFSFSSVSELSNSELIKDFYSYCSFGVRINDKELNTPMILTNDIEHYLPGDHEITYAEGYDISSISSGARLCLVGKETAEQLGISPGSQIELIPEAVYSALAETFKEDEGKLLAAVKRKTEPYHVAGIIESDAAGMNNGIFAEINSAAEYAFGDYFTVDYSEFNLADNDRLDELEKLMEEEKVRGWEQAPLASYYIDSVGVENIQRICKLLESMFPIAVAVVLLIGLLGPGLIIVQSAREAAYLRILGVTKKRTWCMMVLEQILLCLAGIALVVCALFLYSPGLSARSMETLIKCFLLYFMSCVFGAFAAAILVTRHKILELLHVKE